MNPLLNQKCRPIRDGQPMPAGEIDAHLAQCPGWTRVDGAIEKTYRFADYHRTLAFVNALAWIAHTEDHHPDLLVQYGSCKVRYSTHSVGGLSLNDFICAAKVDALQG